MYTRLASSAVTVGDAAAPKRAIEDNGSSSYYVIYVALSHRVAAFTFRTHCCVIGCLITRRKPIAHCPTSSSRVTVATGYRAMRNTQSVLYRGRSRSTREVVGSLSAGASLQTKNLVGKRSCNRRHVIANSIIPYRCAYSEVATSARNCFVPEASRLVTG